MGREYLRRVEAMLVQIPPDDVLLYDIFPGVINWEKSGTGGEDISFITTDYSVPSNSAASSGCCLMKTRSSTPAVGDVVTISKNLPISPAERYEFSCMLKPLIQGDELSSYEFGVKTDYAGTTYLFHVRFFQSDLTWKYWSAPGPLWTPLPTQPADPFTGFWILVKISFDAKTGRWISVTVADTEVDMSYIAGMPGTYNSPHIRLSISLISSVAEQQWMAVDQVSVREL